MDAHTVILVVSIAHRGGNVFPAVLPEGLDLVLCEGDAQARDCPLGEPFRCGETG